MHRILIRNALCVATQNDSLGEIQGGDVLIEGSKIALVAKKINANADEVIDASGHLVVPGFVNTHHHLYQVLTRNLREVQDSKLFDWLKYLYRVWQHLTAEDVHAAALAGLGELLVSGCTTSADHHYVCTASEPTEMFHAEVEAAAKLGIRFQLTRGSMSLGESHGGLPPDSVIQDEDTILKDSERVIDSFHDANAFSMCRVALAPCSPFSVSSELMRSVAALARKHQVRLHTHLAETLDEENYCLERFGRRPLQYAEELGWLGADVWFAHCVFLNDDEIRILGRTGTGVAHCPVSNLRLGSGIARIPQMLKEHVPVGLAVDGSASNDSSNMLRELQMALLVHRVGSSVDAMSCRKVLQMATSGGAKVLGREEIGVLAPGLAADIALFDLRGLAYSGALHDPVAALLFCGVDSRAACVLVNGKVVVRDHRLVSVDESGITVNAHQASRRLLGAAGIVA